MQLRWVGSCALLSACMESGLNSVGVEADHPRPGPSDPQGAPPVADTDTTDTRETTDTLDSPDTPDDTGEPWKAPSEVPCGECEAEGGARCWFVAKDGDDGHEGTMEAPLRHIWAALDRVLPGDVVYVREGTWGREAERAAVSCGDGDHHTSIVPLVRFSPWGTDGEGRQCADAWPALDVASGTEDAPITLAACGGEHVILDGEPTKVLDPNDLVDASHEGWPDSAPRAEAVRVVWVSDARSHWRIRGFDIVGGAMHIEGWGNATSEIPEVALENNPHDIVIEGNTIRNVETWGGENPGMIKIDRGDYFGPYDIVVRGNHIYDMRANGTSEWSQTDDGHFGAITTLSVQSYAGVDHGGTGRIVVEGNWIHDVPYAFYFKNAAEGPIEVRGNRIWNTHGLGLLAPSNLAMEHNIVRASMGWTEVGTETTDPELYLLAGQNAVVRYNTFLDMHSLMKLFSGTGHIIEHNVVAGLWADAASAGWDTPAVIAQSGSWPDRVSTEDSQLQQVLMDHNCYLSEADDFQHTSRHLSPTSTGGDWVLEHYDASGATNTFGFDGASVFLSRDDEALVFTDPSAGDHSIRADSACAGAGADVDRLAPAAHGSP